MRGFDTLRCYLTTSIGFRVEAIRFTLLNTSLLIILCFASEPNDSQDFNGPEQII
jgi:hypothetical protein